MRTLSKILFLCGLLLIAQEGTALAYSNYGWWSRSEGGYYYCVQPSAGNHTNWNSIIDAAVAEYNNLNYTNPDFSRVTTCSSAHKVEFAAIPNETGLCGQTTLTTDSRGHINSLRYIRYTSHQVYWDGTNTGGCNFRFTTLHEYGHAQGLNHSCSSTAVMWGSDNQVTHLSNDDKYGMRWIYDDNFLGPQTPDSPHC